MKHNALQSVFKLKTATSNFIKYFLLANLSILFFSCQQPNEYKPSKKALEVNNHAVKIVMKVTGLEYPKDSLNNAIKLYKQAIAEEPDYKLAYSNLWECYKTMNKYNEMIDLCSQWLKKNEHDIDMRHKRAMVYELQGKNSLANGDYNEVINQIEKEPQLKISSTLTPLQIEQAVSRAFMVYVDKKNQPEALIILSDLKNQFPNNNTVNNAYNEVLKNDRIGKIQSLLNYFPTKS